MTTAVTPTFPIAFGAYEEAIRSITLCADSTLAEYTGAPGLPGSPKPHTGKQYRFVKITGPHQVGLATAGEDVVGVLQNKPQVDGEAATVTIRGVVIVRAGGAIAAGDLVTTDANGLAVKTTDVTKKVGRAVSNVAGVDRLVSVLLTL